MNGYIEGGYLVTLVTLGGYATTLLGRERLALRRRSEQGEGAGRESSGEQDPNGGES